MSHNSVQKNKNVNYPYVQSGQSKKHSTRQTKQSVSSKKQGRVCVSSIITGLTLFRAISKLRDGKSTINYRQARYNYIQDLYSQV